MVALLKLLGKGLLYAILLPVGIVFFAIAGVFLLIYWIIEAIIFATKFLKGKKEILTLPLDIEARKILDNSRDFSDDSKQSNVQPVQINLNINGQLAGSTIQNAIEQSKASETIDYTEIENKEDK